MDQKSKSISKSASYLKAKATGAYIGLAIGDALGATVEFMTPREIRTNHDVHRDITGGGWLHLRPGQVTDDTEMTLALGAAILSRKKLDEVAVADAFSDWMRCKPVDIGNTVRRGIVHYRKTGQTAVAVSEHDAGNGACMRCLPVALLHWNDSEETLITASRKQAHITHNSAVADAGTETVLKMVSAAMKGLPKSQLREYSDELVDRFPVFRYDRKAVENPSGWIVDTLKAVFQSFFNNDTFEQTLIDVVNRGGDADTTGAIAGMLAGASYGISAIPERWYRILDKKIIDSCETQAKELLYLSGIQNG